MSGHEIEYTPSNLGGNEMRARLTVWATLAQLSHSDGLHDGDYDRLAGELLAAGHTAESARHMLVHHVAPVFYEKLTVMGDTGTHWPAGVVEKMMRDFLNKSEASRVWLQSQASRMSRKLLRGGWGQIELRMRLATLLDEA